jgi:hypothetical protein
METQAIQEGNWYFPRQVVKSGAIQEITISRAISYYESDFWSWFMSAVTGGKNYSVGGITYRRTLLLLHYFAHNPLGGAGSAIGALSNLLATVLATNSIANVAGAGIGAVASLTGKNLNIGPFEFVARVPARAYILKDCVPTSWKGGSDFDAMRGDVSIAELSFVCEGIELVDLSQTLKGLVGGLLGA